MYHSIILELLCDLVALAKSSGAPVPLSQTDVFLRNGSKNGPMVVIHTHPDGEIAFFNDAATNIAYPPKLLFEEAGRLGCKSQGVGSERVSSFIRVWLCKDVSKGEAVLFARRGYCIGPSYLPGHGHADALSFELSLFSRRLFVNLGTSEYGHGIRRQFERSTAAHNTLELNNEISSEGLEWFRLVVVHGFSI